MHHFPPADVTFFSVEPAEDWSNETPFNNVDASCDVQAEASDSFLFPFLQSLASAQSASPKGASSGAFRRTLAPLLRFDFSHLLAGPQNSSLLLDGAQGW